MAKAATETTLPIGQPTLVEKDLGAGPYFAANVDKDKDKDKGRYTLTVHIAPPAGGSVSPGSGTYERGKMVTLTATANANYAFDQWSGDASGSSSHVSITMNDNKTVTANFKHQEYTLTVNIAPSGGGSVTPSNGTYPKGTKVQLTAKANSGYCFDYWTGDAHGSRKSVRITMDHNETVQANFKKCKEKKCKKNPHDCDCEDED